MASTVTYRRSQLWSCSSSHEHLNLLSTTTRLPRFTSLLPLTDKAAQGTYNKPRQCLARCDAQQYWLPLINKVAGRPLTDRPTTKGVDRMRWGRDDREHESLPAKSGMLPNTPLNSRLGCLRGHYIVILIADHGCSMNS